MKYKVGDKVRIKSLDWYNENKDSNGNVVFSSKVPHFSWRENVRTVFTKDMSKFCGKVVTIETVWTVNYSIVEGTNIDYFTDEMIEGLVEEELQSKFNVGDVVYSRTWQRDVIIQEILPNGFYKVGDIQGLGWFKESEDNLRKEKITLPTDSHSKEVFKHKISLPEGYQFVDEGGNIINTTKIVLEKKKKEYPKTYLKCCDILEIQDIISQGVNGYLRDKLETLQKLFICRDAYWKLYGEEMGLGKPWEPDWKNEEDWIHCITTDCGEIYCTGFRGGNKILAFPTAEMRDAFYENFKEEIEICKKFL